MSCVTAAGSVVVVVVVEVVCAKAVVSAIALTAPAANNFSQSVLFHVCPLLWLNGCSPSCIYPTARSGSLFNRTFISYAGDRVRLHRAQSRSFDCRDEANSHAIAPRLSRFPSKRLRRTELHLRSLAGSRAPLRLRRMGRAASWNRPSSTRRKAARRSSSSSSISPTKANAKWRCGPS